MRLIIISCLSTTFRFILSHRNVFIQSCGNVLIGETIEKIGQELHERSTTRTSDEHQHMVQGIVKREEKRRKRIKAAGIDYECPDLVGLRQPATKKIKFNEEDD